MRTRLGLRRLTRDSERVDRSFQTAARVKGTGTLAKPACPPNGIASDALAARPEGDTQAASHRVGSRRSEKYRYGMTSVATRKSRTIAIAAPSAKWLPLKVVSNM